MLADLEDLSVDPCGRVDLEDLERAALDPVDQNLFLDGQNLFREGLNLFREEQSLNLLQE